MNKKSAVVLIEFQNEWLHPSGALYPYIENQLLEKNIVSNTLSVIEAAKNKNFYIIHVPLVYSDEHYEIRKSCEGVSKLIKENKRFSSSSDGSNIYKPFTPKNDEIVIRGRSDISGFSGSNLDYILHSNDIQELYFAGFVSEVCVLSTLLEAYNKNYSCRLLTDCSLGHTEEDHRYVKNLVDRFFGYSLNNQQFFNKLEKY